MPDRYNSLSLTNNPFPLPGSIEAIEGIQLIDPEQAGKELTDALKHFNPTIRKAEIEWIDKHLIDKLRNGEKCSNLWVSGPKGVGKSILLKYLVANLKDTNILPVYVKYPERGLPQILEVLVRWFGEERLSRIAEVAFSVYSKEHASKLNEALKDMEEADRTSLKKVTDDTNGSEIIDDFESWLQAAKGTHPKIAYVVANYYSLTKEDRIIAIGKMRGKGDIAAALTSLVRLASDTIGTKTVLLVLDEIELLWRGWPSSKRQNFSVWVRGIHETAGDGLRIVMSQVPDILTRQEIESKYRHIADVLPFTPTTVLNVKVLDNNSAKELIARYLQPARKPGTKGFIEPFSESAVQELNLRYRGLPREILYNCYSLVELAADQGLTTIDSNMLSQLAVTA